MSKFVVAASLIVAATLAGQTADGQVVYREVFPIADGSGRQQITTANWGLRLRFAGDLSGGTEASGFHNDLTSNGVTFGDVVPAINSNPAVDSPGLGFVENFYGGDFWNVPSVYYTEEFTLDRSANTVNSFTWAQNNQEALSGFRVVARIGTDWFASDTNFVGFLFDATLQVSGAVWRPFDFATVTVGETTVPALPAGDLTAFGLYTAHTGYEVFDSFTINATPATTLILGDFDFDGEVLDSDIQLFVKALTGDFAGLIELFPTRTEAEFTFIGDFNGDGEVLDSDIGGFVAALLGGGGRVTAIPEPAALGLLAPVGLLLARRRR